MNKAERELIWEALSYAINDRRSLRDAYSGIVGSDADLVRAECDKFEAAVEAFCQKHFRQASAVKQADDWISEQPFVSLSELREQHYRNKTNEQ